MLRRIAPTLLLLAIAHFVYSQNKGFNGSLSISAGPSFPIGDFGKSDLRDDASGFAGIGQNINVSYHLPFTKSLGLVAYASAQRNPLNTKKLEAEYNNAEFYKPVLYVGGSFPMVIPPPQTIKFEHWQFKKKSWFTGAVMGGVQLTSEPINNRILFNTRALFGITYLSLPEIYGKSQSDTSIAEYKQSSANGVGFTFGFSGGMNYSLNRNSFLSFNVGWFGSNDVKLRNIKSTFSSVVTGNGPTGSWGQSSTRTAPGKQSTQSVNLSVGIGFKL